MKSFFKIIIWLVISCEALLILFIVFSKFFYEENKFSMKKEYKQEDFFIPVFKKSDITEEIEARISGKSYVKNNDIDIKDLSYLTISYYDFDGNRKNGEMIVNKSVADEVLEIFKKLYENKYMIEKMELIDNYNASDYDSIEANNTSAFCYRNIDSTNELSKHALGLAIDINPLQNPYVVNGVTTHDVSNRYLDREIHKKGMILDDDVCVKAFKEKGWQWGGDWSNVKDYQHFEKIIKK